MLSYGHHVRPVIIEAEAADLKRESTDRVLHYA